MTAATGNATKSRIVQRFPRVIARSMTSGSTMLTSASPPTASIFVGSAIPRSQLIQGRGRVHRGSPGQARVELRCPVEVRTYPRESQRAPDSKLPPRSCEIRAATAPVHPGQVMPPSDCFPSGIARPLRTPVRPVKTQRRGNEQGRRRPIDPQVDEAGGMRRLGARPDFFQVTPQDLQRLVEREQEFIAPVPIHVGRTNSVNLSPGHIPPCSRALRRRR